jgi:hypothetical protein
VQEKKSMESIIKKYPEYSHEEINIAYNSTKLLYDEVINNQYYNLKKIPKFQKVVDYLKLKFPNLPNETYETAADKIFYLYMK